MLLLLPSVCPGPGPWWKPSYRRLVDVYKGRESRTDFEDSRLQEKSSFQRKGLGGTPVYIFFSEDVFRIVRSMRNTLWRSV